MALLAGACAAASAPPVARRKQRALADFGAVGDGRVDDTRAIAHALQASAAEGLLIKGRRDARYRVSATGRKQFLSPDGGTHVRSYALDVPDGAAIDFGFGRLFGAAGDVLLCNRQPLLDSDRVHVHNAVLDGEGGRGPLAIFMGCRDSAIAGLSFTNVVENAAIFAALEACDVGSLAARNVTGTAIMLGGNSVYQLHRCRLGDFRTADIRSLGTYHQPGNPIVIGATDCTVRSISARNCAGGIKFTANCARIRCGPLSFDGLPASRNLERFASQNSGIKVQGDSIEAQAVDISIEAVVSRHCDGAGLFIKHARRVNLGQYLGVDNSRLGLDADVHCEAADAVNIGTLASRYGGYLALYAGPGMGGMSAREVLVTTRRTGEMIAKRSGDLQLELVKIVRSGKHP